MPQNGEEMRHQGTNTAGAHTPSASDEPDEEEDTLDRLLLQLVNNGNLRIPHRKIGEYGAPSTKEGGDVKGAVNGLSIGMHPYISISHRFQIMQNTHAARQLPTNEAPFCPARLPCKLVRWPPKPFQEQLMAN